MTTRTESGKADPTIESRDDLLAVFASGEKPAERWRIGTEHEKFVYRTADFAAPSYDEPGGIRDLLDGLTRFGWTPVVEGGNVIALTGKDGAISLEPAGQLELSGAPLDNLHETCSEAARHLAQVKQVGDELGLGFLGLGMWPDKTRAELPVIGTRRLFIHRSVAKPLCGRAAEVRQKADTQREQGNGREDDGFSHQDFSGFL